MKTTSTESVNGLLFGRKHRDFVNLNGLGFAPLTSAVHADLGGPIPEGLTPEEEKEAWREWDNAINADREHWKNASEYERRKYPELYARKCHEYGL